MTPAERVKAAAALREPDQVPVMVGLTAAVLMKFAGITAQDYYSSPKKALAGMTAFQRRFPDLLTKGGFKTAYRDEPLMSGLGFKVEWDNGRPELDTKSIPIDSIKVPDPAKAGIMPRVLDELHYFASHTDSELKAHYGDLLWVVSAGGPLGGIGDILGYGPMFQMIYEEPKRLHQLLEIYTQAAQVWVRAQERAYQSAGVATGMAFMVDEALPLVSLDAAKEFFLPYAKRIFAAVSAKIKIFHCDNDVAHVLEVIAGMGAQVYDFNFSSPDLLKRELSTSVCLMGNVPAIEVLQDGTPAEVMAACRKIIAVAGPRGGFILASAGGITPDTPLENLAAMVAAAKKYGSYPIKARPASSRQVEISKKREEQILDFERQLDPGVVLDRISKSVIDGKAADTRVSVQEALASRTSPDAILEQGLSRGLKVVSEKNFLKLAFLPELTMANKAFLAGLNVLEQYSSLGETKGKVVMGTVQGNLMESGINLVAAMLRASGFSVYNLGVNVPAQEFVTAAKKEKADLIALGVYTSDRLQIVAQVAELIREEQLPCKILVGGKGISPAKAGEAGAHAFAGDANQAVEKAKELLAECRFGLR